MKSNFGVSGGRNFDVYIEICNELADLMFRDINVFIDFGLDKLEFDHFIHSLSIYNLQQLRNHFFQKKKQINRRIVLIRRALLFKLKTVIRSERNYTPLRKLPDSELLEWIKLWTDSIDCGSLYSCVVGYDKTKIKKIKHLSARMKHLQKMKKKCKDDKQIIPDIEIHEAELLFYLRRFSKIGKELWSKTLSARFTDYVVFYVLTKEDKQISTEKAEIYELFCMN